MIKVYKENIGMNNQNIFKIIKALDTDEFREFIKDFDESTLSEDICDAVNNATGSAIVCISNNTDEKIQVKINDKPIFIKDRESFIAEYQEVVNLNQSFEIQDFIATKCSLEWIDTDQPILPE